MVMLHKLLYKNNKYKYFGILFLEIIVSVLNFVFIRSFVTEDSGMSVLYVFVALQFVNIMLYIMFRLIYKKEILLLKEDGIHIFIIKKHAKRAMLINKLFQVVLFFIYQFIFTGLVAVINKSPIIEIKLIILNFIISIVAFLILAINDIAVINKYRNNYFDGIANKGFVISFFVLVNNPYPVLAIISLIALILSAVINFIIIMKGDCKVD